MDWSEFGLLLNEHLYLYLQLLVFSVIVYIFIFRKVYISFLDPFIFSVVFSVFGFSVVLFLYLTNNIPEIYLISYLLTQVAFWLGFFSFKQLNKESIQRESSDVTFDYQLHFIKYFLIFSSIIYILLQVSSYLYVGIPLLMESHVNTYAGSGLGVLGRFLDVLKIIVIFLLLYRIFLTKMTTSFRLFAGFMTITMVAFFLLSGSKAEFMLIGQILFCVLILNATKLKKQFNDIRKYEKWIFVIGLIFVFAVIFVQAGAGVNDGDTPISIFLFRLVSSGDTYYFSYPGGIIERFDGSSPFMALFGGIFVALRIFPSESMPDSVGYTMFKWFYTSDATIGPNARHNVFGYVYFGFIGSILFSFIIGFIISYVRNKLFFKLKKNVLGQLLFVFAYVNLAIIETDPPSAISNFENTLLILPIVLFMALIFSGINKFKFSYSNKIEL